MTRRLGVLGGTFDPIHQGHLRMARAAARACRLDRIYFVPAPRPGHKPPPVAAYPDRFAMLALALAHQPHWRPLDIPAPGRSSTYAVDQVAWIIQHYPGNRIFWIVGADSFATLPSWKRYRRLLTLCDFIVLARVGFGLDQILAVLPASVLPASGTFVHSGPTTIVPLAGGRRFYWLADFATAASSTNVRKTLTRPHPRPGLTPAIPAAVALYAHRAGLYRAPQRAAP